MTSAHAKLKVALVSDELTRASLSHECTVIDIPADDFGGLDSAAKPDLLLVESAWHGIRSSWKGRIASYPLWMLRGNGRLRSLLRRARGRGIPTVFWNKEDGVHFERFIDSAKLFDHVFTVDENCIDRYRSIVPETSTVSVLPFAVQPATHNFSGFNFKSFTANFVGSYSQHLHHDRRLWQDFVFETCEEVGFGLRVYDRNSGRARRVYRYPPNSVMEVHAAVSHAETANIYKHHLVSLNVNTVRDSRTMFSRRLVEILACGGVAVTSAARSVEALFAEYCHIVDSRDEAYELFARLRHGPSDEDLDRAREGSRQVLMHHTWAQRLDQITTTLGL